MNEEEKNKAKGISGYGTGGVDTVISVEEVTRKVAAIAEDVPVEKLNALAGDKSLPIDR